MRRSKEFRVYVDGKLANINYSDFGLMNNVISYENTYGKDRVKYIAYKTPITDEKLIKEKQEWVNNGFKIKEEE